MNKLTAEKCSYHIDRLQGYVREGYCLSLIEVDTLSAFEIALPTLEQQGGWIDVSKREPNLGWNCLVWYADKFPAVMRITNRSLNERDFTHWMKIPDAPQSTTDTFRQIDNDGWIEWGGGECPVADGVKVDFKFRDGDIFFSEYPEIWEWKHDEHDEQDCDIIAYRVIENDGREG